MLILQFKSKLSKKPDREVVFFHYNFYFLRQRSIIRISGFVVLINALSSYAGLQVNGPWTILFALWLHFALVTLKLYSLLAPGYILR